MLVSGYYVGMDACLGERPCGAMEGHPKSGILSPLLTFKREVINKGEKKITKEQK